ncbi:MAG: 3-deoxy-manno-octulosonate cytidylyltransferase, partial [Elusimicrobia bacterium]|nr:3-deoxy-manno-octulosonate cytidylyltransferase [Elusimicrobiota bacterium]
MNIIGIIPARMGSSRFPGKPLAKICGMAMIYHVYMRSKMAACMNDLYIATCDAEIEDYCKKNNMNVVMTSSSHERASDRTREAMKKIEAITSKIIDIIVMIQGDEPMIYPEMIQQAVEPMVNDGSINVVNLMGTLKNAEEKNDPNEIKIVTGLNGNALFMSRQPIPMEFKSHAPSYKQICVIPYRREFLETFSNLTPTPLEIAESIDMLRIIEHGYSVKMIKTDYDTYSV